jgi:hypothetical protein
MLLTEIDFRSAHNLLRELWRSRDFGSSEAKLSHGGQTTVHTEQDRLGYAHRDILPFARIRSTMPNDTGFPVKNATYRVITQSPDATNFSWRVMPLRIERSPLIPRADPLCRNPGEAAPAAPALPRSELLRTKSADEGVTIPFRFRHARVPCPKDNSARRFATGCPAVGIADSTTTKRAGVPWRKRSPLLWLVERIASSDRAVV